MPKKKPFLPITEAGKVAWLNNFVDRLQDATSGYATKYNILAGTITQLDQGRQWVNWSFAGLTVVRNGSQALTAFKNQLFNGSGALTAPAALVFDPAPAVALAAGVFNLATSVGVQIKASPQYTVADGEDLGLEGAAEPVPPPGVVAPDLSKSRLTSGGFAELVWKKDIYDAVKLMVDRGDGHGPVFLAVGTHRSFTDTVKPAAGQSAIYTYTAIYLLNDQEFGQWSQSLQLTLRG